MTARIAWTLALLGVVLAGCAEDPGGAATDADGAGRVDASAEGMRTDAIGFAADGFSMMDSFTGTFQLQDSQMFDDGAAALGMEQEQLRAHDITALLPTEGLFMLDVQAVADAANGDIDIWLDHDGTIRTWWCDCPFGDTNRIIAYGVGDGLPVTLYIQYDEVSSGPDDPGIAFQGFDYQIDVQTTAGPTMLAPGLPYAVELETAGDELRFDGHASPITIYGPDDLQVAVLGPGDSSFLLEEAMAPGEYVFIQRLEGVPFEAQIAHGQATPPEARILAIAYDGDSKAFAAGEAGRIEFDSTPGVIEVGACGFTNEASIDPSVQVIDPTGAQWSASSSSGPVLLGWGTCASNWPGSPDQLLGTWTAEFMDTAGDGGELHWWVGSYLRG